MREEKSYNGLLMEKGTKNENIIMDWLKTTNRAIVDFREFRLAQRIDVDFGIETIDGTIMLAEIKSDKWISQQGNLCFECHRINHYSFGNWFYLGWGWRSPAQKLIVRNPLSGDTFVFYFTGLREFIASYVAEQGRNFKTKINLVETDKQKTTFNWLIPMVILSSIYTKYMVIEMD